MAKPANGCTCGATGQMVGLSSPESAGSFVQTAEGRKAPSTDDGRASTFKSMIAYLGMMRTRERQIIINVDVAWDKSWIGTEQVSRIESDKLHVVAPSQQYANFGGRMLRGRSHMATRSRSIKWGVSLFTDTGRVLPRPFSLHKTLLNSSTRPRR